MAKKKKKAKEKKKEYNPISYTKAADPGKYTSAYTKQIQNAQKAMTSARNEMATARKNIMNFKYDPLKDAQYQAMAQVYGARGNQAAQDTLGDAAALNGGMQTSYAVSAAQQARNQYNQELASLVPEFEQNAYNRLTTNYGLLESNYGLLQDNYDMYKDLDTEAYNRYRDRIADYQWGKGYDTDIYQYKQQQKGSGGGGGGGGGRRRRSGGGGSYGGSSSGSSDADLRRWYGKAAANVNKKSSGTGFKAPPTGGTMGSAQWQLMKNRINKKK